MLKLAKLDSKQRSEFATDFWHSQNWINYCVASSFSTGIDCSVGIQNSGTIIGFIPLIKRDAEFSFQGSFCPEVILQNPKELEKVTSLLVDHARSHNIKRIAIKGFHPGFLNYNIPVQKVNPFSPTFRKSYKSIINKGHRELTHQIIDDSNPQLINYHVELIRSTYFRITGKVTRPPATFEFYKSWIHRGRASLIIAYKNQDLAGFTLITHYKNEAYYFMAGTLPNYKVYNINHYIQSVVIDLLKRKGIESYILGSVDRNSLLSSPTPKERDIGFFKSGFGTTHYEPVSEYFLSKDYFKYCMEQRIKNYIGAEYDVKDGNILPEAGT